MVALKEVFKIDHKNYKNRAFADKSMGIDMHVAKLKSSSI